MTEKRQTSQGYIIRILHRLLTDVVFLTPSDKKLPSAYPSCILNSFVLGANHLAVFKRVRANWKPPY
jgi:hypothetical protein